MTKNPNQTIAFLKALSETNRFKIISLLLKNDHCVCEISQILKLPQNLVSHHLKILKNLNLLTPKRVGQKIYYRLNKNQLIKYYQILGKYLNAKTN